MGRPVRPLATLGAVSGLLASPTVLARVSATDGARFGDNDEIEMHEQLQRSAWVDHIGKYEPINQCHKGRRVVEDVATLADDHARVWRSATPLHHPPQITNCRSLTHTK